MIQTPWGTCEYHAGSVSCLNPSALNEKGEREMPHFSICCPGADSYICQVCGHDKCSACQPSVWRTDITKCSSAGNVCPTCLQRYNIIRGNRVEMEDISFCPLCKEEISTGWGNRVECPNCEKWVTTTKIHVPKLIKEVA